MEELMLNVSSVVAPVLFCVLVGWGLAILEQSWAGSAPARSGVTRSLVLRIFVATLISAMLAVAGAPPGGRMAVAATPTAIPIGDADGDGDVDLDDLAKRIGDSKAIGMLTKLSLKREIDGLEQDLKAFHDGAVKSTLAKLHERYNLLVHKLTSLLQDKDPRLARDIARSRELLWAKLADRDEFRRM